VRENIPENAAVRLCLYLRHLRKMKKDKVVSSEELAEFIRTSGARVRKDLSFFGQFGTTGKGYVVGELEETISKILGLDQVWTIALVGAGKLGMALLEYPGFKESGFHIRIAFDVDQSKIGKKLVGVPVCHPYQMPKKIRQQEINMGLIAVPAEAAQESADLLIISGIKAILNFASATLIVPSYVKLMQVDLTSQLEIMAYFLSHTGEEKILTKRPKWR